MQKKLLLFVLIKMLFCGWLHAQNTHIDLEKINEKRLSVNSSGMLVLGGWAVFYLFLIWFSIFQADQKAED